MWIIGNWKMHKTTAQAHAYLEELATALDREGVELKGKNQLALAVPFTTLSRAIEFSHTGLKGLLIGAQNMHEAKFGPFTGEISCEMLVDLNVDFVLLGHSERRHAFAESDQQIACKVARALSDSKMRVILCVGETLIERQAGLWKKRISQQIESAILDLNLRDISRLSIAYEPVWAIGTGQVATLDQIELVICFIQEEIARLVPRAKLLCLYGGSIQRENAAKIASLALVDGLLVGGACLEASALASLAKASFTCSA